MSEGRFVIRPITADDDDAVAAIIRTVMPAFGAAGPGFALHDDEVGHMSAAYAGPRAHYLVVVDTETGAVVGGAGIAPLEGGPATTCELKKMYFLPAARGHGVGARTLGALLDAARARGFTHCYLETLTGMDAAMKLYAKMGFIERTAPCGATGHFSCDRYFERAL